MPSVEEVLNTAQRYGFDYAIVFVDKSGDVKVAIGLNGLTKRVVEAINTYIDLLNKFGVTYNVSVYDVDKKQQITILDIPMFFTIVEDVQQPTSRPGGYM